MTEDLRTKVFHSLDNALENGYDQVLDYLPEIVANDLEEYDSTYEGLSPADLVPHVDAWQKSKKGA
jgi:hypothetical protein